MNMRPYINASFPFVAAHFCLLFMFFFFFQAFLGDLFQQHHKDVSSDKLEEYTDTMVALRFIMLDLRTVLLQPLISLCYICYVDWLLKPWETNIAGLVRLLGHYGNSCIAWRTLPEKISFPTTPPLSHCQLTFLGAMSVETLHLSAKLHFDRQ